MTNWFYDQPNYAEQERILQAQGQAEKLLGKRLGSPAARRMAEGFNATLNDPLYLDLAARLGIKDYDSVKDYNQITNAILGKAIQDGGGNGGKGNNGADGDKLPAPNDGEYGHIEENIKWQGQKGRDTADEYNNKPVDESGGDPINVDDLTGSGSTLDPAQRQIQMLKKLMINQRTAFKDQLALQRQQLQAADAAYAEQLRQSDALSRAYIPAPSQSAVAPVLNMSSNAGVSSNTLSSLRSMAIGGSRTIGGTSLSGLQIA
jgi:hypothetical protein